MQTYPIKNIAAAREIVRVYRLDQLDWEGAGTANGFVHFLFILGMDMTVSQLAYQLDAYKALFRTEAKNGRDLDARLEEDAINLCATLDDYADERAALAVSVQKIKYGPNGGMLWNAIANLATSVESSEQLTTLSEQGLLPQLQDNLLALYGFIEGFSDSLALEYTPGRNAHMDFLVRQDILRLEDTLLHGEPWAGAEPDWFEEIGALLRLASGEVSNTVDEMVAAAAQTA